MTVRNALTLEHRVNRHVRRGRTVGRRGGRRHRGGLGDDLEPVEHVENEPGGGAKGGVVVDDHHTDGSSATLRRQAVDSPRRRSSLRKTGTALTRRWTSFSSLRSSFVKTA